MLPVALAAGAEALGISPIWAGGGGVSMPTGGIAWGGGGGASGGGVCARPRQL